MLIDDWGNEYGTEKEAAEGLLKILRSRDDYYDVIANYMDIPHEVMEWIVEQNLYEQFAKNFSISIKHAELSWVEDYLCSCDYFNGDE